MKETATGFEKNTVRNLDQAHRLLKNISDIISTLNQKGVHLTKKLDSILTILLDYLGAAHGSIMVLEGKKLQVVAASRKELIGITQSLETDSIAASVANSLEPVYIKDITKTTKFKNRPRKPYKKKALLSAPIIQDGKLLGVINVTDKVGTKDLLKEDMAYLLNFSGMIISTLMQQKLQKVMRRQKNTLNQRNKELHRQEKMRDDLYRMLIHDLKTPLAEVVANLDILSYSISEENKDFLEAAQLGCDRTVRMVSNLVTINKMEDGKLTPYKEEVAAKILIEEAYSAIKGLAKIKNIALKIDVAENLPNLFLDRILVLRVLQNLLTNALGYTDPGTTITIGCFQVPNKKKIEFFVQDEGPGIAVDKQAKIFDKYSRLSDRQDALVGTGLGLYFCKLAVETHRGKIWIESAPGQGSRFCFVLAL